MKKISIIIMVLVVALASCKKTPEVNLKYVDVERDLVTVGTTTANIQCDYDYIATLKKAYLYYGEGENEDAFTSAEMRVVQNTLYVELTGLRENTTYNYFYEFHNGFNSMRTALKSFKTETSPGGVTLPTVITAAVTEITTNSAKGGGEVTDDGGAEVTERGICWSTNANPTINNSYIAAGSGMGAFTAVMSDLEANTTYHVRAYAINEAGTAYGLDREFVTLSNGGGNNHEGALSGLFSVAPERWVRFSKGNLQYQASTNTWRFAEHQWDYVGSTDNVVFGEPSGTVPESSNHLASSFYSGWIDLFGWGTSGYHDSSDPYNINYQPWSNVIVDSISVISTYNYWGFGPSTNMPSSNLTGSSANYDWGVYNSIINGGNQANTWRTLSWQEWDFVTEHRSTTSNTRYAKAQVNGINGVILFPDNWNAALISINSANDKEAHYDSNVISSVQWELFEQNSAVFLPAAGAGPALGQFNEIGYYWQTEGTSGNSVYDFLIQNTSLSAMNSNPRYCRFSVRLVQDDNP